MCKAFLIRSFIEFVIKDNRVHGFVVFISSKERRPYKQIASSCKKKQRENIFNKSLLRCLSISVQFVKRALYCKHNKEALWYPNSSSAWHD